MSGKQCFNILFTKEVEGEVVAWDQTTKVLVIKTEANTRANYSNVQIVNLDFVSEVKVSQVFFY